MCKEERAACAVRREGKGHDGKFQQRTANYKNVDSNFKKEHFRNSSNKKHNNQKEKEKNYNN